MEKRSSLQNIYDYPEFNETDYNIIFSYHEQVNLNKGDLLLKEGQISNYYYCIESGLARSFVVSNEGKEITTRYYGKNQIIIDVSSFFLRTPTRENIEILTDTKCWRIDFYSFNLLFGSINHFKDWGRTWMTKELINTKNRSLSIITDSATDRYIALLKENPDIILHSPLKYIASYLGVTDTSLSRIRKELAKLNL